jgi:allantoin racemase
VRIHVFNPNTSAAMTERIGDAARKAASAHTQIVANGSTDGPASIECAHDAALALPWLLAAVRDADRAGADAHVIACFGDPGLAAAREVARAPVLGIAEAAIKSATFVAARFAIVTTLERAVGASAALVREYGAQTRCVGIRAIDLPVLALDGGGEDVHERLLGACRRAVGRDRAEAIVLGCAGMADRTARLTEALGVPVIDGVAAAVRLAEALIGLGLRTSKRGDHAAPPPKPFSGQAAAFAFHSGARS